MSPTNDEMSNALGGLLGALIGGNPAVQANMKQSGNSLDQVLGTLSGGSAPTGGSQASPLGEILGGLMGGGAPSGSGQASPLGDILGGLLGGGAASGRPSQASGGDPIGAILGGLLGSGMSSQGIPSGGGDPMSSVLGGLLGVDMTGGNTASTVANNPIANAFISPIVDALVRKTGIARGIAQVVVVFGITTLLSGLPQQGMQQSTQQGAQQGTQKRTQKGKRTGFAADDLVGKLSSGEGVTQKYLKDSGLVTQLVQQTGLDQKTASQSLQQVFSALGTHMGDGTMADHQADLQSLLKTWK